jgi:hypothetical protein
MKPTGKPGSHAYKTFAVCPRSVQAALTTDQARELALALPEAVEQDHHGRPSFRVSRRIFATLWTERAMNVMAGEERIRAAAADRSHVCREVFWGKRLAAVQIDLERADPELLGDLLDHAWRAKAPARLVRETALSNASPPGPTEPRARG